MPFLAPCLRSAKDLSGERCSLLTWDKTYCNLLRRPKKNELGVLPFLNLDLLSVRRTRLIIYYDFYSVKVYLLQGFDVPTNIAAPCACFIAVATPLV